MNCDPEQISFWLWVELDNSGVVGGSVRHCPADGGHVFRVRFSQAEATRLEGAPEDAGGELWNGLWVNLRKVFERFDVRADDQWDGETGPGVGWDFVVQ